MSEEQKAHAEQLSPEEVEEEKQDLVQKDPQNSPVLQRHNMLDPQQVEEKFETSMMNDGKQDEDPDASANFQSLDFQFVLDIPLQVTVELGRKRILIQDLLKLNHGSIIELTKQVSEPLDVLVNQKLIARGEVVVVHDKFGIRITDIISPKERLHQIQ